METRTLDEFTVSARLLKVLDDLRMMIDLIPVAEVYSLGRRLSNLESNAREIIADLELAIRDNQRMKALIKLHSSIQAIIDYLNFVNRIHSIETSILKNRLQFIAGQIIIENPEISAFINTGSLKLEFATNKI
jgi:hypothetical protein